MMTRIGGALRRHRADLHRRGVRAQHLALALFVGGEEEGVVHLAGRMALGEVERREIEVVGLDVRPLGHGEAHIGEDRRQLLDHLADRVDAAAGLGRLLARAASRRCARLRAALRGRPRRACPSWPRSRACTLSRRPLMSGPRSLRSSGVIAPRVFRRSETEPFLPSAETRTASRAASSPAASTWVEQVTFELIEIGHRSLARCRRFE